MSATPDAAALPLAKRRPRRRWLRFSLRTLFVGLSAFSVWLGFQADRAHRQRRAVEDLEAIGAKVNYAHQVEIEDEVSVGMDLEAAPPGPAWLRRWTGDDFFQRAAVVSYRNQELRDIRAEQLASLHGLQIIWANITWANDEDLKEIGGIEDLRIIDLSATAVTDEGIAHLSSLQNLAGLILTATRVSDGGCKHLAQLRSLTWLVVSGTDISDRGVAELAPLRSLRDLSLSETSVSDAGLAHLAGMPQLRSLFLSGTRVTDQGLPHLKTIAALEYLDLDRTGVTDAGIEHLGQLRKLRTLRLRGTAVTEDGATRLRAALPNCNVEFLPTAQPPDLHWKPITERLPRAP